MFKAANLAQLLDVPGDFEDQRGYDNNTTKTNATDQFYFEFGIGEFSSFLDQAARELYQALGNNGEASETQEDLLTYIEKYLESCLMVDDKIIWETVKEANNEAAQFDTEDLDQQLMEESKNEHG